jgi:hypothetical protein
MQTPSSSPNTRCGEARRKQLDKRHKGGADCAAALVRVHQHGHPCAVLGGDEARVCELDAEHVVLAEQPPDDGHGPQSVHDDTLLDPRGRPV